LPNRIESIYEIHRRIPVDALLLTNLRTPYEMGEQRKYLMLSDQSLPLYRNVKFYNRGALIAKLFIRDEREWRSFILGRQEEVFEEGGR